MRTARVIATFMVTIVATLLSPYISLGQNSIIEFEEPSHYFGNIRESGGVVSCLFICKNVGDYPLLIDEVRTGCDCTTAEWHEEEIAPGGSDTITVHFNPKGLPGKFIKSIALFANTSPSATTLTIRGYVIPREEGEEDALPEEASGVELGDGLGGSADCISEEEGSQIEESANAERATNSKREGKRLRERRAKN